MAFARARHHRGVPAIVAEFTDRSLERRTAGKDHRTLDEIFQLTNISRPMPAGELPHGPNGNRFDLPLHTAAILMREVADQERNVSGTFAQGWDADRKYIQAIVQVAAELAILHHLFEITIGRRHQPHIHLLGSVAAQPFKLTFLQSAQEFRLNLNRNISHLVEKQRALVGKFKSPNFLCNRASEGASFMSKKLALEQSGRDRSAVELYEGPLLAPTAFMDRACNQFLACAGFPEKQHRGVAGSHGFHQIQHMTESGTLPHNSFKVQLASNFIFQIEFFLCELVF